MTLRILSEGNRNLAYLDFEPDANQRLFASGRAARFRSRCGSIVRNGGLALLNKNDPDAVFGLFAAGIAVDHGSAKG